MRIGLQKKDDAWRAPAAKLYQLLIAPLEAHFSKNKLQPQTLTLYLSDRLRLLPFAALLDGQGQFLTQKYRLSTYTAAAGDNAGKAPQQHWGITAFGSTLGSQRDKLPGLPAVKQELQAIVRTTATPQGILPGKLLIDPAFTLNAWRAMLESKAAQGQRSVLHVATHFNLAPGNFLESTLLLGDENTYSVRELHLALADRKVQCRVGCVYICQISRYNPRLLLYLFHIGRLCPNL